MDKKIKKLPTMSRMNFLSTPKNLGSKILSVSNFIFGETRQDCEVLNSKNKISKGLGNFLLMNILSKDIPSNLVTLQSEISNRYSRTKGSSINGNVYKEVKGGLL